MTDRAIAITALESIQSLKDALTKHSDEFRSYLHKRDAEDGAHLRKHAELEGKRVALEERVTSLEDNSANNHHIPISVVSDARAELPSSHEWDEDFIRAGRLISMRVKDPKDRLDSSRARAIAAEVVESAKIVDDAKAFRVWRSRGARITWEIMRVLIPLVIGFLASHFALTAATGGH